MGRPRIVEGSGSPGLEILGWGLLWLRAVVAAPMRPRRCGPMHMPAIGAEATGVPVGASGGTGRVDAGRDPRRRALSQRRARGLAADQEEKESRRKTEASP